MMKIWINVLRISAFVFENFILMQDKIWSDFQHELYNSKTNDVLKDV